VVAAGAALADEVGLANLTMGLLAERVGVRTPSLYKHVVGLEDLNRRIAALALTEAADAIGSSVQGLAGRDALAAAMRAFRTFVLTHPGRYAATVGLEPPDEVDHTLRMLRSLCHGFATVQAAKGFQWTTDIDESFDWIIDFVDRGLRAAERPSG
jgi:AcrR family transcriptional regulator